MADPEPIRKLKQHDGHTITSAGVSPTGGEPVGAAVDRVQPDRTVATSRTNAGPADDWSDDPYEEPRLAGAAPDISTLP